MCFEMLPIDWEAGRHMLLVGLVNRQHALHFALDPPGLGIQSCNDHSA
jgi:hypothetical protein